MSKNKVFNDKTESFLTSVDTLESNITYNDLSVESIERPTDKKFYYPGIGNLSNRALKNLSSCLSIPQVLLKTVTEGTMNTLIKEQMARKKFKNFRMSVYEDVIQFLQPAERVYMSYGKIISDLGIPITSVKGDPVLDDVVTLEFCTERFMPSDKYEVFAGFNLRFSSVCVKEPKFTPTLNRLVCTNGLTRKESIGSYRVSHDANNEMMVRDMIKFCFKRSKDIQKDYLEYVEKAIAIKLKEKPEEVVEEITSQVYIPSKTQESARAHVESMKEEPGMLSEYGIEKLSTVWSYINLFTFVVQSLSSYRAIERTGQSLYQWGENKIKTGSV
jgi:hypothetical protein